MCFFNGDTKSSSIILLLKQTTTKDQYFDEKSTVPSNLIIRKFDERKQRQSLRLRRILLAEKHFEFMPCRIMKVEVQFF